MFRLHEHIAYHLKLEKRMDAPTAMLFNGKRLTPLKECVLSRLKQY